MLRKKQQSGPPLEEQIAKIGIGVVKIQETLSGLATKKELNEQMGEVKQRLARLEETKADKSEISELKSDISELKSELKSDISKLNEHLTDLLQRSTEIHQREHRKIEERVVKLEAAISPT